MKKFAFVLLMCVLCNAAAAAELEKPVLIDKTRIGSEFFLVACDKADEMITVIIRCIYSEEERNKISGLLVKQGVELEVAESLRSCEFSLRYSPDGDEFQRRYDRLFDGEGNMIRNLRQNTEAWYDMHATAVLPRLAFETAEKILNSKDVTEN